MPSIETQVKFSLTLGSSHITLVAAQQDHKRLQVLGAARIPHKGIIKKGIVSSLEDLTESILETTDEVERQTGLEVKNILLCIPNSSAICENHNEKSIIKSSEIKENDIRKLFLNAQNLRPSNNFYTIHDLPGEFCVDEKTEIKNPIGMHAKEVSLSFHRVNLPQSDLSNIARATSQAGLKIKNFIYESIAAAEGCLTFEDKEYGCVSISMGTYSSHVCVYINHFPVFTKEFPIGSQQITKDLAIGLRISQTEAEQLKKEFGRTYYFRSRENPDCIEIKSLETSELRKVAKYEIAQIMQPRVSEIFNIIKEELVRHQLINEIPKGVVLSGGGSLLQGITPLAEKIFGVHARIGLPLSIAGAVEGLKSPLWTAALGSFSPYFQSQNSSEFCFDLQENSKMKSMVTKFWKKVKDPFASP